ncbi:outer membrane beta-barrel protein [Microbulbifer sp. SSSA002]|uniref:outer membrane beta-barrel protein n=1 Tax=unclassified Microbulbifer TaxID=2619833 RepID=UPI004039BCD2
MKISKLLLLPLALTISSISTAEEKPLYVGFGMGYHDFDGQKAQSDHYLDGQRFGDQTNSINIYLGYQFNQHFSVEAAYQHFNSANDEYRALVNSYDYETDGYRYIYVNDDETLEVSSFQLNSVAHYPVLEKLTLSASLGLSYTRVDSEFRPVSTWWSLISPVNRYSEKDFDLTYGLGAKYDFTDNISGRLQWKRIDNDIIAVNGFNLSLETHF